MISDNIKQLQQHKRELQTQVATLTNTAAKIDQALSSLASIGGGEIPIPFGKVPKGKKKGGMSAAGRAAIRQAQVKRWAKINKGKTPTKAKTSAKRKNKISVAGLAKIKAAQKKRWAAYNKAKAGKK